MRIQAKKNLSAMAKSFVRAVKAPALRFNALTKEQKNSVIFKTLACGGLCLAATLPALMVGQGISHTEMVEGFKGVPSYESIKEYLNYNRLLNDMFTDNIAEKIRPVFGTAVSGALVCVTNLGISKIFSNEAEPSDGKKRQITRLKEISSDSIGFVRWVPQFIEGVSELTSFKGISTAVAAGTAKLSYGTSVLHRSVQFTGRLVNKDFDLAKLSVKFDRTMREIPGKTLIWRGPIQAIPAVITGITVDPLVGAVWGLGAAFQTAAGFMKLNKDKPYQKPPTQAAPQLP